MTSLMYNIDVYSDGVAIEPREQPNGFYDELKVEVVFIDSRTKKIISKVYYLSHKHRINALKATIEEVEP